MRCRIRYKTGWTAFLFIFSIAGVILTYRQLSDKQDVDEKMKSGFVMDSLRDSHVHNNVVNMAIKKTPHEIPEEENKSAEKEQSYFKEQTLLLSKQLLMKLYPENWGTATDADEMAFEVKAMLSDMGYDSEMSCKDIDFLRISQAVKIGSKKYVDRAYIKNKNIEVVLKSQGNDLQIKVKCMQKVYDADKCHVMGNYLLLRELLLLSILKHPGIINVLGYCIRGDHIDSDIKKKGMLIVQESGTPVNPGTFHFQPWDARLKFAIQLATLLDYLEHSPLGSVGLIGIRAADFVTTSENQLKLVDLDDVQIEERPCKADVECKILSASTSAISCVNGRCTNWNAKNNIQSVGPSIFHPLLSNPPLKDVNFVNKLKDDILRLSVTAKEILSNLETLQKPSVQEEEKHEEPHREVNQPFRVPQQRNNVPHGQGEGRAQVQVAHEDVQSRDEISNRDRQQMEIQNNKILRNDEQSDKSLVYEGFTRFNQSNFPGLFDYTCSASRVVWGCVITIHNLKEAVEICDRDPMCKSFVLFTSNPDAEALMTMVAKNSGNAQPQSNVGATLFVRKTEMKVKEKKPADSKPAQSQAESDEQCRIRTQNITADARSSREKRLMTHLGLKGTSEDFWKVVMRNANIINCNGLDRLTASSTIGGRFDVEMGGLKNNLQKAIFLAEVGPSQYHISHLIVYYVDRILGLYHTPPTINLPLRKSDIVKVTGDKAWIEHLGLLMSDKEDLKGILTASMPKVVKPEKVKIEKLKHVVSEVVPFTRIEKLNLEYVFLWHLTKIIYQDDFHFGYKGHLMHFGADQAFQDLNVNLLGYFYHCQFPNIVYKALSCYKCTGLSICSLGQEVMQKLLGSGYSHRDINIHNLTPTEITSIINDAASSVLIIVDGCIRKFGREVVLY